MRSTETDVLRHQFVLGLSVALTTISLLTEIRPPPYLPIALSLPPSTTSLFSSSASAELERILLHTIHLNALHPDFYLISRLESAQSWPISHSLSVLSITEAHLPHSSENRCPNLW
jgi:hypothetical protein